MKIIRTDLAIGAMWTIAGYAGMQGLRFATNVILARLLSPELFGMMIVVNAVRTGAELLSDLGVTQCVVKRGPHAGPDFLDTAWTMQALRGVALLIIGALLATPISNLYGNHELAPLISVAAIGLLINGFTSLAPAILQGRMELERLNTFELLCVFAFAIFQILIAWLNPTVWSLVYGLLFGAAFRVMASYALVPELRHRLRLSYEEARIIFGFGRWIGLSSIAYFLSSSFDRLYLASAISMSELGFYGIARTVVDVVSQSVLSLANYLIFPFISRNAQQERRALRSRVAPYRLVFVFFLAVCLAILAVLADLAIQSIFDSRYHAAGWMASLLFLGAWFSVLCSLNEATLLGLSRPSFGAAANVVKLMWLAVALPVSLQTYGLPGAIVVVSSADFWRYIPVLAGQRREGFSFLQQDLVATAFLAGTFYGLAWLRGMPVLGGNSVFGLF